MILPDDRRVEGRGHEHPSATVLGQWCGGGRRMRWWVIITMSRRGAGVECLFDYNLPVLYLICNLIAVLRFTPTHTPSAHCKCPAAVMVRVVGVSGAIAVQ